MPLHSSLRTTLLAGAALMALTTAPTLAQDAPSAEACAALDAAAAEAAGCEVAVERPIGTDGAPAPEAAPVETDPASAAEPVTEAAPAETPADAPATPETTVEAEVPASIEEVAPEATDAAPEAPAEGPAEDAQDTPPEAVEVTPEATEAVTATETDGVAADAPAAESVDTAPAEAVMPEPVTPEASMEEVPAAPAPAAPEAARPADETAAPAQPEASANESDAAVPTPPPAPEDLGTPEAPLSDQIIAPDAPAQNPAQDPAVPQPAASEAAPAPTEPAAPAATDGQAQTAPAPALAPAAEQLAPQQLRVEQEASARAAADAAVAEAQAAEAARSEAQRAEDRRDRRNILGAAAAGALVGAIVPQIGARLIGQQDDRVFFEREGELIVRSDPFARFTRDGLPVERELLAEGRERVTVTRPDGSRVITLLDEAGYPIRRVRVLPNGDEIVLLDVEEEAFLYGETPIYLDEADLPPLELSIPDDAYIVETRSATPVQVRAALEAPVVQEVPRRFTIAEVTQSERVRSYVPRVDLDTITFATGSAEVSLDQARSLASLGQGLQGAIDEDPRELFLIEGHTDAVGSDLTNLSLSDRRAETVASLLTDLYGVPAENLITQGYGEAYLKEPTLGPSQANRRVTVRRITPLVSAQN